MLSPASLLWQLFLLNSKKWGGTCLSIVVRHDRDYFLIFNEMFVLKKCTFKMGTLVQESNPRALLMFLIWMRFLSCAFPHPTSTPWASACCLFQSACTEMSLMLESFLLCTGGKGIWRQLLKFVCRLDSFPTQWSIFKGDSSAGGGWCGCVSCCFQLFLGTKLFWEAYLSYLLLKKDNEHRLIWYFGINYCMVILSNV